MKRLKSSSASRFILLLFFALFVGANLYADEPLNYEIEGVEVGAQGTYLVKVWVVSKKNKVESDVLKKCAVHGVLFKGVYNKEKRIAQKPLAGTAAVEQQHADYFAEFFKDGGAYRSYANMVTPQVEVVKSGKKEYRIGATLTVLKEQLYKDLVAAGILKNLNSIF